MSHASLSPGQQLTVGESLVSADGRFTLILQQDGNLVLYGPQHQPLWDSKTDNRPSHRVTMQTDGDLVIYDGNDSTLWKSGTDGFSDSELVVQNNGNVVIYGTNGHALWYTDTEVPQTPKKPTKGDRLESYQGLMPGESLESPDGSWKLVLQIDGNLVQLANNEPRWSSNTNGVRNIWDVVMQGDGNLCIRDAHNTPVWATKTDGNKGSSFVVQNDGNLVVYNAQNHPIWDTGAK